MRANVSVIGHWREHAPRLSGSMLAWIGVLAYFVAVKLALVFAFPHALADPSQASFFTWPSLGVIWLCGWLGVWLSQKTGFPDALAPDVSTRRRLLTPALIGLGLGVVFVGLDQATGFSTRIAAEHGLTQQYTGFLPMLVAFPAAAVIVEVVYRLLLVPLLLWLVSHVILRGRGQVHTFWVLAVLTSLIEPASQFPTVRILAPALAAALMALQFGLNLAQAAFFRRYGFIAAIVLRMTFYVVWHVLYIH